MDRLTIVAQFAGELIREYVPEYTFQFDNAKRRLGVCKYRQKVIGLSKYHALESSDDAVIDTILHEIAHALVGAGHGHNHVWKAKCREIGAKPERCGEALVNVSHKYEFRCQPCNRVSPRHRKPRNPHGYTCRKCKTRVTFHEVG